MARSRYYHDPARKHIEVFQDFSGGLNTQTANENLADNEMTTLENFDLSSRGSLKKVTGFSEHLPAYVNGTPQGYFRFFKQDGTYDEVLVIGGKFFINGTETQVGTQTEPFQTDRPMEATQYYQKLYIATGEGLVEYDGSTLDFVTPYRPQPLEALYVGTNGLMTDPDDFIETTSGDVAVTKVKGVRFDKRYGVQNEFITIDLFAEKVNSGDTLEWKVERKRPSDKDDYWFVSQDWATSSSHTFSTDWTGSIKFRISVRVQGEATADEYIVPNYTIKASADPDDEPLSSASISNCNRIFVHWDRLIMYGDTGQPDVIYISHLKNPAYFPVTNSLRFNNVRQEGLTKIVQFRDSLVAFTDTTIQALYGKSPVGDDPYQRVMLNSSTGCIAPESAKVTDNYISFLSYEGVYRLKSLGYTENKANVEPIDEKIQEDIPQDRQAVGFVHDNQYHLVFPSIQKIYRFYYERGVWSMTSSEHFDYQLSSFFDGVVYLQGADGRLVKTDESVLTIEESTPVARFESKAFDYGQPYSVKKVKEMHLMVQPTQPTLVRVEMWVDGELTGDNIHYLPIDRDVEKYTLTMTGKGQLTKVVIEHEDTTHLQIDGFAVVFKLKKP